VPTLRAGQEIEVYYRHDRDDRESPFVGSNEVYLQGSFNRWKHPSHFGPVQMALAPTPPGGEGAQPALVFKVWIPEDAHVMDFVFTDAPNAGAGRYDSQYGLDYHAHVGGGSGAAPALRVVHVAVEMAPIAKVGGMGDVVTALCRAVIDKGHSVEVILPKYDCMDHEQIDGLHQVDQFRHDG
jgi:starch synthase